MAPRVHRGPGNNSAPPEAHANRGTHPRTKTRPGRSPDVGPAAGAQISELALARFAQPSAVRMKVGAQNPVAFTAPPGIEMTPAASPHRHATSGGTGSRSQPHNATAPLRTSASRHPHSHPQSPSKSSTWHGLDGSTSAHSNPAQNAHRTALSNHTAPFQGAFRPGTTNARIRLPHIKSPPSTPSAGTQTTNWSTPPLNKPVLAPLARYRYKRALIIEKTSPTVPGLARLSTPIQPTACPEAT
ncbi:uncharacterized protein MONBRDRAFT_22560 [Monosiga brevicollis MX1]|uniref:Uncharacterized protein n=1 Tax=Monosiga brevicollis TaxID=81824 RepID=A9UQX9_MONBE|nr:uncharacterized protein MONBRDRAFT_22560 [Monosiga brevicollis MX1]EDQ93123.1 predicted protein [Monosiga brevicollis MX1]|eukprot:XP_001742885.1 hypothetical protein [Monosiga brevicollis MX1]